MTHLMYNERLNIFGVKLPDWNFVLTLQQIPCYRRGSISWTQVSTTYDCDFEWQFIDHITL
jgi:hypothetical protein